MSVVHPIHLAGESATWAELFADYEILQPFPQLGRPVHALTDEEKADHRLRRFENLVVPTGKVLGLQHRGWERGDPQDAGMEGWISRRLTVDSYLIIGLEDGIVAGLANDEPTQTLVKVWLGSRPDDYRPCDEHSLRFADLAPIPASEILADLTDLTKQLVT